MARLVTSGFELQDASTTGTNAAPDGLVGSGTIDTTVFRSGAASFKSAAGVLQRVTFGGWTGVLGTYFARAYVMFDALPAGGGMSVLALGTVGMGSIHGSVVINVDGSVTFFRNNGSGTLVQFTNTAANYVTTNVWYMFEISITLGTGSIDAAEGRIDGLSIGSVSSVSIGDGPTVEMRMGKNADQSNTSSTANVWIDDVALNDSSGASQNTFPGPGKVVLLLPTADSSFGAGWTLGTGTGITNGFDSINNTPPLGVADLAVGSDPKQIRNASANANVNFDTNMTTYRAAGISNYDIIRVVSPVIATAAPVSTSAKSGTVGVASNPIITNVALGAGGSAGAFWSGVAAGTYPTGWKWSYGTTTYNPVVTIAAGAIMRVTQVTSSTRIAMVSFMGIIVEYEPHSPPSPITHSEKMSMARSW